MGNTIKLSKEEKSFTKYLKFVECNDGDTIIQIVFKKMEKEKAPCTKNEFKKYLKLYFEKTGLYDEAPNLNKDFCENEIKKLINRIANRIIFEN